MPRIQIIEEPHGPASERPTKRLRPGIEGAIPLYQIGSTMGSSQPCTVYLLKDRTGLVVVDDSTVEALCEHVHVLDVAKLGAEQHRTGRPCPSCQSLPAGVETNRGQDGPIATAEPDGPIFLTRSKAVVLEEKNVAVIENIKPEGYTGGLSEEVLKKVTPVE